MAEIFVRHRLLTKECNFGGVIAIVADPHAERFYLRLGARRVGEVAGPMPGAPDRKLPLLELDARQG